MIQRTGEAIVLRTWPFHEADLLVSLFTRESGKVKGVARHALRSRRRFGGALEPMTHVRATFAERPRQELARLDAFETVWSPLSGAVDYERVTALELLAEVLERAMPEGAPDDAIFRLTTSVLPVMERGQVEWPVVYFTLWMNRLLGWMPELGRCAACGARLAGETAWHSAGADGVTCGEDRARDSVVLTKESVALAARMFREPVAAFAGSERPGGQSAELGRMAVAVLERHLEHRLISARALWRA